MFYHASLVLLALSSAQAGPGTMIVTAVGQETASLQPVVFSSADAGATWSRKPVQGLPNTGSFETSSCTGEGGTAVCIAAGYRLSNCASSSCPDGVQSPVLAASTDGATTWTMPTVPDLGEATGTYLGSSCTGSGRTAMCVAVGFSDVRNNSPLLALSNNGGVNWTQPAIAEPPAGGRLVAVSCSGAEASSVCVAVGRRIATVEGKSTSVPLIIASSDGGKTWATHTVEGMATTGTFSGVGCSGSGASAVCTVAGSDEASPAPILATSKDGGATWQGAGAGDWSAHGPFSGASCAGTGDATVCAAVGMPCAQGDTCAATLVVTGDAGAGWGIAAEAAGLKNGGLTQISCTSTTAAPVCAAVGADSTGMPLLVATADGGKSWSTKSIDATPTQQAYNAVSCTGEGTAAGCAVAGWDPTSAKAFVLVSAHGGFNWDKHIATGMDGVQLHGVGSAGLR